MCQIFVHGVRYTVISNDFIVSHPYVTPNIEEDPLRPIHQKILEEKQARANHVVDMLLICYYIMTIGREVIAMGGFQEGRGGTGCHLLGYIVDMLLS